MILDRLCNNKDQQLKEAKRECNRHFDCDDADRKARARGALRADHCHDDCCEECFGN